MSYNPYIQRILIEQIQEFEELDLQELDPNDLALENKLVLVAYDIQTRRFFTFYYDLVGGNIIVNYNTDLTTDHIVNTDDLSTPRGFTFKQGWTLDNVVAALCNPPIPPELTLDYTLPNSNVFVQVNAQTTVTLSYTYDQKSGGIIDTSYPIVYKKEGLNMTTNIDQLTATSPGDTNYSVELRTLSSPQYPSMNMTATTKVKAVYPFLIDAGPQNTLASIGTLQDNQVQELHNIDSTRYLIANFPSLVAEAQPAPKNYYWFATQKDYIPVEWVAIDANGIESSLNRGPIATGFSSIGNLTYKGNSYKIWMGIQLTFYSNRIKIKF